MKYTVPIAALLLTASPALATSFDLYNLNGQTATVDATADYQFGELFIDDLLGIELSVLALLDSDGGFDPAAQAGDELSYFPADALSGDIWDVRYGMSSIEMLFEVTTDGFAGQPWGEAVIATINFGGLIDWSGGVALDDLAVTSATVTLNGATPIPLPGTLPLLMGAIALGAAARRVRL